MPLWRCPRRRRVSLGMVYPRSARLVKWYIPLPENCAGMGEVSFFSEELGFDASLLAKSSDRMRNSEPLATSGRLPARRFTPGLRAGFRQQRAQGAVHVHHGSRSLRCQGTRRNLSSARRRTPNSCSPHGETTWTPLGFVQHIVAALRGLRRSFLIRGLRQAAERQGYSDVTD